MKVRMSRERYSSLKLPSLWRYIQELPLGFLLMLVVIIGLGTMTLYSAAGGQMQPWASAHIVRVVAFLPVMLFIAVMPQVFWLRLSPIIYVGGILILVAVLAIGVEGGLGAQRWLSIGGFTFQPSEMVKVALVLMLASYYHFLHANQISHPFFLLIPMALILVPSILVLMQPNLGTAVITGMVGAVMLFVAGVRKWVFAGGIGLLGAAAPLVWYFVLHDYQKQRVLTFLDPEKDPLGAGYNIIQSKIAIGSGGWTGKGFVEGTQSQLAFIPEKHTDFIFSIFAEEFGLIGSLGLIGCYAILFLGAFIIAFRAQEVFARLMAVGMSSILFLHVFINMGMVMGILPVVGVPLPLMSYGGSSMLSTLIACGFILNAHIYRNGNLPSDDG